MASISFGLLSIGLLGSSSLGLAQSSAPTVLWKADFEDGKVLDKVVNHPSVANAAVSEEVAFRGNKSLLHDHFSDSNGNYVTTVQALASPLQRGKTYTLSCWAKCELMEGGGAVLTFQWANDGRQDGTRIDGPFPKWTQFVATLTPTNDIATVQARFSTWPKFGRIWLDEMVLVEGDKPMLPSTGTPRDERKPREVFVSASSGSDTNSGAADAPFKTVMLANLRSPAGSTITLLPGSYDGGITLKAGTKDHPTVLRAARKGRVFIGSPLVLAGFVRAAGLEYTYAVSCDAAPTTLIESDSGNFLRYMASVEDVEELAGTYCFDEKAKKLYVHPSDSAGVAHHTYSAVGGGIGVLLADYTVVDGLVLSGFGDAAIRGINLTGAVVQNCILYSNGYGIEFQQGRDCVIRGNEAWNNCPGYGEGAQVMITCDPVASGFLVENNVVHHTPRMGIRFYSGTARNCVTRGNLTYANGKGGFYYKANKISNLLAEGNVSVGNANYDFGAQNGKGQSGRSAHNTFGSLAGHFAVADPTDLVLDKIDWKFADTAYHDYRLQSDSPARGKAPDRSDLGAFPYDGSVVFVRPDGRNANDGTSVARARKTLAHAAKNLKPGQTLYIEASEWTEPLVLQNLKANIGKPTRVRIRGKAKALFPSILIEDCEHLRLEGLRVAKGGIVVKGSAGIELLRCASWDGKSSGISLAGSKRISVDSCASFGNSGAGVEVGADCEDVEVTSSILASNKLHSIQLAGQIAAFYADKNSSEAPPSARAGDFRIELSTPLAPAGRYGRPVGPDGVIAARKIDRKPVERVEVISTTPTSANITFWTPGRICGTAIEWGKSKAYGNSHERGPEAESEYETYHTVSLLGLERKTTYHFRVGFRDFHATPAQKVNGKDPLVWSDDFTFTTAAADPVPRQLYVSLEGDDRNDGLNPKTAWRTLHKAAREAHVGDTVTIAPGRYLELLRPVQTGTSEKSRITFRAERPLTVFLDGGLIKFVRDGRSHCIQVQTKAFLTLENLTCEKVQNFDNGGYRDGYGYSGLIGISGSAGIEIKNCVLDARYRWMGCIWAFEAGNMPGAPPEAPAFVVTDSLLLNGWRAAGIGSTRPCIFRNCALVRSMTGMITETDHGGPIILRNNIFQSLIPSKQGASLLTRAYRYDSNYNCFAWDAKNQERFIVPKISGLKAWQDSPKDFVKSLQAKLNYKVSGAKIIQARDAHSLEAEPGYPLSKMCGFNGGDLKGDTLDTRPLTIHDLILPKDSPLRGKGENGEDLGPRWERWLK